MPGHEPDTTMTATFSGEDSSGLGRLTADMGALSQINQLLFENQAAMAQTAESAVVFRDQYVTTMTGLSQDVQNSMSRLIAGGYMAMARAFSEMVASGQFLAAAFGQAMLRMSAQAILAVGQQAAVKALFALAEGLMMAATPGMQGNAAAFFAAAKMYGAVAVGAPSPVGPPPVAAEQAGGGIVVNIRVAGNNYDTQGLIEDEIGPAIAEWAGRGGAASAEYNLTVDRD